MPQQLKEYAFLRLFFVIELTTLLKWNILILKIVYIIHNEL